MASHEDATLFFTLPLELREHIYKEVLASPAQGPELLRTCREIKTEAHKFLFQRPINFHSQLSLYEWLDQAPHNLLPHVTEVSLTIQDVNFRTLLEPEASNSQPTTPPRLLTSELYEVEIGKLDQALKQLPKVKTVTIRALSTRQSFLYRDFLAKVLELLSSMCPTLLDLRLEGNMHHQSLRFLTGLQHLRCFSFDGFSSTSATETADILASLEHLSSLTLVSQHELLMPSTYLQSGFTSKPQSFTGDVVRTINQLASFSVIERTPTPSTTLFLTSEVLASLQGHKALNSLSIILSYTPDDETLLSLQEFLRRSDIHRLELDWPDLKPGILGEYSLVQEDLKTLWVRAQSASDAYTALVPIFESRHEGGLPNLRKIVLIRANKDDSKSRVASSDRKDSGIGVSENKKLHGAPIDRIFDKDELCQIKRRLQVLGIQVLWCTESE
ncbi:uncharacterized protein K460DRAFT_345818 [Cucurbitaria berberidis CBS 394.84]|uniref:Uncharacterized protein n=1 Tax=Cucurbitaria berberidis CBS 394.84 TaxID=1168544 RepID=A0A9P4GB72_9PLEO|nr:uncharacterized protein K460DRAFT_345818 [Cucurbitaria berberidis CBS 394.84]KAF1842186.1 hypothetical protein K460DRAFT_345818 [Cucurbitaria berberidis CBS 394.84]